MLRVFAFSVLVVGLLVQRGLCVEPRNADLKKNLKEIDELIRADKVRLEELSYTVYFLESIRKRCSLLCTAEHPAATRMDERGYMTSGMW